MTTLRFALAAACITTVSLGAVAVSRADKERASPHVEGLELSLDR